MLHVINPMLRCAISFSVLFAGFVLPLAAESDSETLAEQVESLKQAALNLNRDLLLLEEELLFPGNTQVAVFVSMDVGEFFQLDAIKVKIDDKVVGSHLYTEKQVSALYRGGIPGEQYSRNSCARSNCIDEFSLQPCVFL